MQHTKLLAYAGAITLITGITGTVMADNLPISKLPDRGTVTVSGTIDRVQSERTFTVRDDTGSIDVRMAPGTSAVLKPGESVTVSGQMERPLWGLLGKDISATDVSVHKDLSSAITDTITKTTGLTLDRADNVRIGRLPQQGMVQITGRVDKVSDAKHFTLKDPTGAVDVSVQSDENVMVSKGMELAVTGYVNNGFLGKKIRATHVILVSSAPTGNEPRTD